MPVNRGRGPIIPDDETGDDQGAIDPTNPDNDTEDDGDTSVGNDGPGGTAPTRGDLDPDYGDNTGGSGGSGGSGGGGGSGNGSDSGGGSGSGGGESGDSVAETGPGPGSGGSSGSDSDGGRVGRDGPGGRIPTGDELTGGRTPSETGDRDSDEPPREFDGPSGTVGGDELTGPGPNTGLEDNTQEEYNVGLEGEDEQDTDLSGLEDDSDLRDGVAEGVTQLENELANRGIDDSDYAIRRDGDQLTVDYDEAGVAETLSEDILDQNPRADEGDFAVERTDDGGFRVDWGENAGQADAVDQVQEQVRERYPGITSDDYAVRETPDGGLTVSFSSEFQEQAARDRASEVRREASAGRLGEQLLEDQIEDQNPGTDVSVGRNQDGTFAVDQVRTGSESSQTDMTVEEQIAAQNDGLDPEDVTVRERTLEDGDLGQGDRRDFSENPVNVEVSDEARREQLQQRANELEADNAALELSVVETEDGEFELQRQEKFGDVAIRVPDAVPNLGGDRVEDILGDAADSINRGVDDATAATFNEGGFASESLIAEGLEAAGQDQAADQFESSLRSFGKGTMQGAGAIVNAPAALLGLKEIGEFTAEGVSETGEGDGVEYLGETYDAAEDVGRKAVETASNNPISFSGQAFGALAGSYTLISGVSKVSSRGGRAAAYAVQPGEELATTAVNRLPGASRVASKFPNNRIDNEEPVIAAGKKVKDRIAPAARRAKYDLQNRAAPEIRRFLRDDKAQGSLVPDGGRQLSRSREGSQNTVEVDDVSYQDFETELREQELSQTQEMLSEAGEAELSARREQLGDATTSPSSQTQAVARNDQLTFDPRQLDEAPQATREIGASDAYRGGVRGQRGTGQDLSGVGVELQAMRRSASRPELDTNPRGELDSNTAAPFERGRFETRFSQDQAQDPTQRMAVNVRLDARERGRGAESLDSGSESEFETQADQSQELDTELGLETQQDTELDLGQETVTETEPYGFEQETETETETELALERNTEVESEYEGDKQNNRNQQNLLEADTTDDLFGSGIASVDDLSN